MNLLGKITKTQLLLVFMTVSFLLTLSVLYEKAAGTAVGVDYTITTSLRAEEPVTPQAPALIDLNTATAEELQTLNGIGEAMAQRIIDYRIEHGAFTCVEDLLHVKGIGEATLEKFRAHVTVSLPDVSEIPVPEQEESEIQEPENEDEIAEPEESEPAEDTEEPDAEPEFPLIIDLNTATAEELQTLSGIGPVLAQRIIDYRTEYGAFTCVDDLVNVKGIGEATLEQFRDRVTVSVQNREESREPEPSEETDAGKAEQSDLLDINTATAEELQTLIGIGPVLAQRIIDYRTENGAFTCVDDLLNVKGIGEATLNKFREQITVVLPENGEVTEETTTAEGDPE